LTAELRSCSFAARTNDYFLLRKVNMAARTIKVPTNMDSPQPMATYEMPRQQNVSPFSIAAMVSGFTNNAGLVFLGLSVLVIGFLAGSLWTENKLLKSGTGIVAAAPQAAPAAPGAQAPTPTTATVDVGHFPALGNKDAKIAIVEFADFRCPFCKQFFEQTKPSIIKDYVDTGKAKFYYRQYQFLGPASTLAGNAVECANDQGKFWEFFDLLYKDQPSESDTSMYTNEKMTATATGLGMNGPKFSECLTTNKFNDNLGKDLADGNQAGGGSLGTPSFVIGKIGADGKVTGSLVIGAQPYAAFKTALDAIK